MEIIKQYSIYVYIPLIAVIIAVTVVLLMKVFTFSKHLKQLNPKLESIGSGINDASAKIERISQSKDSYSFVLAVLAIFGFAKDVRKNRKKKYSIAESITSAAIRNKGALKKLKVK